MSTHDDGDGRAADPNPGSQSDLDEQQNFGAPDLETWGNNALSAQKSEVNLMAHRGGRPGQPASGQRPMFGGGSPVFAQMPSYTPVTRGPGMAPQPPEPPAPYNPYAPSQPAPAQPGHQTAAGLSYPDLQSPMTYPSPHPAAAPSYQSPHPSAAPGYQSGQPASQPSYFNPQSGYQAADFAPHAYQPAQPPSFTGAEHAGPQTYAGSSFSGGQAFPSQPFGHQSFAEPASGDASYPETNFEQNFADPNFAGQDFAKQNFGDASFPEAQGFDANFSDASFPASQAYGRQEQHAPDTMGGFAQGEDQVGQGFDSYAEEPHQDYGSGQVPPSDPRRQLQAFDAIYDQPPQIALGSTEPRRAPQDFYEGERLDADFLDEGQVLPPPGGRSKATFRSRSAFMVGSALLGAIALGGALAFAYKQSGGGLSGEQPPLVTADNSPVKELPDQPGGKEFPHKNKLIYDRLTNGDEPEAERLVPRQENVAVPALPPATETPGMPMPVASTDLATPPTTQAVPADPNAVAAVDDPSMPDGGPRRVKTARVLPDGSIEQPPMPAAPSETAAIAAPGAAPAAPQLAAAAQAADPAPQAAAPAPQAAAAQPAPAPEPAPAAKPPAQQTAAAAPQAAAAPTKYVVQVASKKNQTEALASFADMQQKYPSLLGSYRPIVQKADLGAKGTWYRLRIGPIPDKTAASKLCSQLKSQGLPDCLVMAAQ